MMIFMNWISFIMFCLSMYSHNKSLLRISQIQYIGPNHPYKLLCILNFCVCSSLLLSNYTLAKTSIFLYFMYILNNNILIIIILLFFILYPLLFILLLMNNNNIHSMNKGIFNNQISVILTFISLLNLYLYHMTIPIFSLFSFLFSI